MSASCSNLALDWISDSLQKLLSVVWGETLSRWQCFPSLQHGLSYGVSPALLLLLLVKVEPQHVESLVPVVAPILNFTQGKICCLDSEFLPGPAGAVYLKSVENNWGIHWCWNPVSQSVVSVGSSWVHTDTAEVGGRLSWAATDPHERLSSRTSPCVPSMKADVYLEFYNSSSLICVSIWSLSQSGRPRVTLHLNWLWLLWRVSDQMFTFIFSLELFFSQSFLSHILTAVLPLQ